MFISSARRSFAAVGASLVLALTLTSCGGSQTDTSADKFDKKFIYITSDPIGQNEFLKSGKIGIESVAASYKGESKTFESKDDGTRRANLESAISQSPDVIVMLGFQFADIAKELSETNPDQKFLLIDTFVDDAPDNLYQATFREHEAAYLLGVEAGALTESGKVGSVVSLDIPLLKKYTAGFAEGAKAENPAVETLKPQVIGGENPFADTARALEQALAYVTTGADHVFAVGAASNGGIMEAATQKGFYSYGVDADQCGMAPGHVVDGTVKRVDKVIETVVGEILDGKTVKEATGSFGLKEGGMSVVGLEKSKDDSKCLIFEKQEAFDKMVAARDQILAGKIKVEDPS